MAAKWRSGVAYCHGLAGNGDFLLDAGDFLGDSRYHLWAEISLRSCSTEGWCRTVCVLSGTSRAPALRISTSAWPVCSRFSCGYVMAAPGSGWWTVALLLDNASVPELDTRLSWRFAEDGRSVACTVIGPGRLSGTGNFTVGADRADEPHTGRHALAGTSQSALPISKRRAWSAITEMGASRSNW